MQKTKIIIVLASILITVICISLITYVYLNQSKQTQNQNNIPNTDSSNQQNHLTTPPVFVSNLEIIHLQTQESWNISEASGLPEYQATVQYGIANSGNKSAETNIEVYFNSSWQYANESLIYIGHTIVRTIKINLHVDDTINLEVKAYANDSNADLNLNLTAQYPRDTLAMNGTFDYVKGYITPNDPTIIALAQNISTNPLTYAFDIRNWVSTHINYNPPTNYDLIIHGQNDYWQFPRETLNLKTGDCEDFAILATSLLRADGWQAKDIYCVIGVNKQTGEGHCFLKTYSLGAWYYWEPQLNSYSLAEDMALLDNYNLVFEFNDQTYKFL